VKLDRLLVFRDTVNYFYYHFIRERFVELFLDIYIHVNFVISLLHWRA